MLGLAVFGYCKQVVILLQNISIYGLPLRDNFQTVILSKYILYMDGYYIYILYVPVREAMIKILRAHK